MFVALVNEVAIMLTNLEFLLYLPKMLTMMILMKRLIKELMFQHV